MEKFTKLQFYNQMEAGAKSKENEAEIWNQAQDQTEKQQKNFRVGIN